MSGPYVFVLKEGYCTVTGDTCRADGSISLIKGKLNVLVDTGLPRDREELIQALHTHAVSVSDIHVVVATHGHSDHVGNISLFPHSLLIVGYDICQGDVYIENSLSGGGSYQVCENVEVLATPGHTCHDVSVVVSQTDRGTVVIAGDLFEREEDLKDESIWRENSHNPEEQQKHREKILSVADVIVPGHGPLFTVPH